jgi:molybdopterin-guanine dinucleotide biosynthesis protein A
MESNEPFGLVLAGGLSTRMGTDKSLLDYRGKPQREYLFELLSGFCTRVFTSCRKGQDVPPALNPIVDSFAYPGPINGILSAFQLYPQNAWLIVAVDMPFVDAEALKLLLNNREGSKLATCFLNTREKFPEPLLTLWEPAAYQPLKRFVESGNISPRVFLETHDINTLLPPTEKILLNINYPKDKESLS